jgi:hypothetical protein
MDAIQSARRRQGLEDSVALSQDSTRVAKRAGRFNTAPKNVTRDAFGRRVVGPTSAQISAGTANPSFYAAQGRADNIAKAKASGTFAQTRFDFNKTNAGSKEMDDEGNIRPVAKAPVEYEYGVDGSSRVKKPKGDAPLGTSPAPSNGTAVPRTAFDKPSPNASNQTSSKPEAPKKPAVMGPTMNTGNRNVFTPIQKQIADAKQSLATKTAAPATKQADARPSTVAKYAAEVENKNPALFGKIKGKGFSGLNTPLNSASNAVAGSPDRAAKRGVFAPKAPAYMPKDITSTAPRGVPMASAANAPIPTVKPAAATPEQLQATVNADPMVKRATEALQRSKDQTAADAPLVAALNEYNKAINTPIMTSRIDSAMKTNRDPMRYGGLATPESTPMNQAQSKSFSEGMDKANQDFLDATKPKPITPRMKGGPMIHPFRKGGHMKMRGGTITHKMNGGMFNKSGVYNAAPGDWNNFNAALAEMDKESASLKPLKKTKAAFIPLMKGGEVEANNEVTMVGEEGPELIFNRKDGTQFVTPADVTAQIVDGLEMEDSHEGKEAMAAAKKRIKNKVRPKLFGGTVGVPYGDPKPNPNMFKSQAGALPQQDPKVGEQTAIRTLENAAMTPGTGVTHGAVNAAKQFHAAAQKNAFETSPGMRGRAIY